MIKNDRKESVSFGLSIFMFTFAQIMCEDEEDRFDIIAFLSSLLGLSTTEHRQEVSGDRLIGIM